MRALLVKGTLWVSKRRALSLLVETCAKGVSYPVKAIQAEGWWVSGVLKGARGLLTHALAVASGR